MVDTDVLTGRREAVVPATVAALGLAAALVLPDHPTVRVALAAAFAVALGWIAVRKPATGVLLLIAWLLAVGVVRRVVSTFQADPIDDPLLLVGAAVTVVLAAGAVERGALRDRDWFGHLVLAFCGLTVIGVVAPYDGPFIDRAAGLLFWLVPILWFWIGRVLVDATTTRRLIVLVAAVGTVAAPYGLRQTLIGYPPWDQEWVLDRGYIALGIYGFENLRPVGFATSASEHGVVISAAAIALLALASRWWTVRRGVAAAAALAAVLCLAAVGLSSIRTAVVLTVFAVGACAAAQRGWTMVRTATVGVAALLALAGAAQLVDPGPLDGRDPFEAVVKHTVSAVRSPWNDPSSTLRAHVDITIDALGTIDDRPFGRGTAGGALTGRAFGGGVAENDIAAATEAFGAVGAALTIALLGGGFVVVARRLRADGPTLEAVFALGLLIVSLRFWLVGSHYATAPLLWLFVGRMARPDP